MNASVLFAENKFAKWLAVERKYSKEIDSVCEVFGGAPSQENTSTMTLIYVVFMAVFSVPSCYCMTKNERIEMRLV
jgi:hypothetical protein